MRKSLLILAMMLCVNLIYAQTEKGTLYVSGSTMLNLSFNSWEVENGEKIERDITNISFIPSIGVFIVDDLVVGLDLIYAHTKDDWKNEVELKETTFAIMPMAKYYIPMDNGIRPFVHAGIGWKKWKIDGDGDGDEGEDIDADGILFGGGVGIAYFVKDNISLDLGVNYIYSKITDKVDGVDADLKEGIFNIRLGISVFFD